MKKNKKLELVGTWFQLINKKGQKIKTIKSSINLISIKKKMQYKNIIGHSTIMFRKEILRKIKNYPKNFIYMQDYAFILNIMKYFKICILPKVLVQNRVVKSSMTFTVPPKRITEERLKLLYYTSKNFKFNFSTRILWLIELTKVNIKSLFT